MSEVLAEYRSLLKHLVHIRWSHLGHDSQEEDDLLDHMDVVWWKLTEAERDEINSEASSRGPLRTLTTPGGLVDVDVESEPGPVRRNAA